jgi:hypothetical protein
MISVIISCEAASAFWLLTTSVYCCAVYNEWIEHLEVVLEQVGYRRQAQRTEDSEGEHYGVDQEPGDHERLDHVAALQIAVESYERQHRDGGDESDSTYRVAGKAQCGDRLGTHVALRPSSDTRRMARTAAMAKTPAAP